MGVGERNATELEGKLGGLKLSEAENSVLKGSWKKKDGGSEGELQAVGKLFFFLKNQVMSRAL